MVKVKSMISRKGNKVPNQFMIWSDEDCYFQSYRSIIARVQGYKYDNFKVVLDSNFWDYSRTTSEYLNQFLNHFKMTEEEHYLDKVNKKVIRKRIDEGIYFLGDLN